jgi:HSP20 family protein
MADTALEQAPSAELTPTEESRGVTFTPRIDILETEPELLLFADLPGVEQDNVDIRFENGELTLRARRTSPQADRTPLAFEYETGDYFRAFRITEQIDAEKIWAELKNGVLTLHLPKVEAVKPRKITVKGG